MKIAVLVKEVPDTYTQRHLDEETGLVDRENAELVLDEIGERSVEAALRLAETVDDPEIQLVSMAREEATANIRKGLAMGADSAVHVTDPALRGADLTLTAETLAKALEHVGFDLVIGGDVATDGNGGALPAMLAELLGVPHLTNLTELTVNGTEVTGTRASDGATIELRADLPAVVSITESFPDPRFPNFKGIMAAKKKPLTALSLDDLGVDAEDLSHPRAIMTAVAAAPPREAGVTVTDDGTGAEQLADFLEQNRLI